MGAWSRIFDLARNMQSSEIRNRLAELVRNGQRATMTSAVVGGFSWKPHKMLQMYTTREWEEQASLWEEGARSHQGITVGANRVD